MFLMQNMQGFGLTKLQGKNKERRRIIFKDKKVEGLNSPE